MVDHKRSAIVTIALAAVVNGYSGGHTAPTHSPGRHSANDTSVACPALGGSHWGGGPLIEVQATPKRAGIWALVFTPHPFAASTDVKIAWRATGSGSLSVVATSDATSQRLRPNVLTRHGSSSWSRSGDEWGTLWRFPNPGCYKITARRSGERASIEVTVRPGVRLRCEDVIDSSEHLHPGYAAVLGRVGLPTADALRAAPSGEADPSARLFAKAGFLIRPGASFELTVPREWRKRLTIGWGSPGQRTAHLAVPPCPSNRFGTQWLAYAGGFWVRNPACVSLFVKAGDKTRRVRIGVGKACPGQDPPPPPPTASRVPPATGSDATP